MVRKCQACKAPALPASLFCSKCGVRLDPIASPYVDTFGSSTSLVPKSRRNKQERRQITLMFCDLVGSTRLSVSLDPEQYGDLILAYREVASAAIRRYGGSIGRYLGDGLLVYFGYPSAHEDDAVRAVRSGLEIISGIAALNSKLVGSDHDPLAVRIAIHTGLVVVGDIRSGEDTEQMAVIGDMPNLAHAVQKRSKENTVTITDATYELVKAHFRCERQGHYLVEGRSRPIDIIEVIGVVDGRARHEALKQLHPMLGREQELELLLESWRQTQEGFGQSVLIRGEPGIGKSRLIQAFTDSLGDRESFVFTCQCSAYHNTSALYPIIDLLSNVVDLQRDDTDIQKLDKLARSVARTDPSLSDFLPFLAETMGISATNLDSLATMDPQEKRQRVFVGLVQWVLALAARKPIVLVVEDLHWADDSTLVLLELLVQQAEAARILLVLTFRPGFKAREALQARSTQLALHRLSPSHCLSMVTYVAGGKDLPTPLLTEILARTDGIPLFVEELTKAIIKSGLLQESYGRYELSGPIPASAIPVTLRDSLTARLDLVSEAKPIAQLAATLGRTFDFTTLLVISASDPTLLENSLTELVQSEFLSQHGIPPDATYSFRHALIQEAAYESLLKRDRQAHHRRIAQTLESSFRKLVDAQPEVIAVHYAGAGLTERAVEFWEIAGRKAGMRSANVEAMAHFSNALQYIATLPRIAARKERELGLLVAMGAQLLITKGNAAPEVLTVYNRALRLSEEVGDTPLLFKTLYGLLVFHIVRGELSEAVPIGERLLTQAEQANDPEFLLQAHRPMGLCRLYLGQFIAARHHLQTALALYEPDRDQTHRFEYGSDPGVLARCNLSWVEWFLGYADRALEYCNDAVEHAKQLAHPHSLGFALSFLASLHQFRGEPREAQTISEMIIDLAQDRALPYWAAWGAMVHGWAIAKQGSAEQGIAELERALDAYSATGAELMKPYGLALLAEAKALSGARVEGLRLANLAAVEAQKRNIRFYEAEIHRLRADLMQKLKEQPREVQQVFNRAMSIAKEQEALSLELKVAISASQTPELNIDLRSIFNRFSEGLGTPLLKSAAELVESQPP
jgi:class 3 adenylate cyclase/predicted ATPase